MNHQKSKLPPPNLEIAVEKLLSEHRHITAFLEERQRVPDVPERERQIRFGAATLVVMAEAGIDEAMSKGNARKADGSDLLDDLRAAKVTMWLARAMLLKSEWQEKQILSFLLRDVDPRTLLQIITHNIGYCCPEGKLPEVLTHLKTLQNLLEME